MYTFISLDVYFLLLHTIKYHSYMLIIKILKIVTLFFLIGKTTYFDVTKTTHFLRLFLILMLVVELVSFAGKLVKRTKSSELVKTVSVSLCVIFSFGLILEAIFMFIPRTHAVGYTHATKLWNKLYWKPLNSFGLRDTEFINEEGKPAYYFVGDSYTAGYGIKKVKDRFSDIMSSRLKDVNALNLGINAVDTSKEFLYLNDIVEKTGIIPKKIFLQYYGNDIDEAAGKNNVDFWGFQPYSSVPYYFVPLIEGSYLINYLYWLFPQSDGRFYKDYLERAYTDPNTITDHFSDLQKFVDYSNSLNAELIIVLIPFVQDLEWSNKVFVGKIKDFFSVQNVKVLDVGNLTKDLSLNKVVVNNNDAHISELVNMLIAEELMKLE